MRISDWSSDVCSSDLLVAVVLVMGQLHPVGTGAHAFGSRHPLGPMPLAVTIAQGIERCGIADTLAAGVLDADHAAGMRIHHQLPGLAGECVRPFDAPAQDRTSVWKVKGVAER